MRGCIKTQSTCVCVYVLVWFICVCVLVHCMVYTIMCVTRAISSTGCYVYSFYFMLHVFSALLYFCYFSMCVCVLCA